VESHGGLILTGENSGSRRETCPSDTLSTTNPTWNDKGANPGLGGERPATNDLSHGTAFIRYNWRFFLSILYPILYFHLIVTDINYVYSIFEHFPGYLFGCA
jgi:hypothetical protein